MFISSKGVEFWQGEVNALPKYRGGEPGEGEKEERERGRVNWVRGRKKKGREGG